MSPRKDIEGARIRSNMSETKGRKREREEVAASLTLKCRGLTARVLNGPSSIFFKSYIRTIIYY